MSSVAHLIYTSDRNTFKNNAVYSAAGTFTGTTAAGTNTKTFTFTMPNTPDMVDIVFNGPADSYGIDPRPANGYFKQGYVYVLGNNVPSGYTDYPTGWLMSATISGTTLTVTAQYVQTFTPALTLTSTNFTVRVVDYSVF